MLAMEGRNDKLCWPGNGDGTCGVEINGEGGTVGGEKSMNNKANKAVSKTMR